MKRNAIERNSLIDLIRLVCAFAVVILHVRNNGGEPFWYISPFTWSIIPFFFMASGYFLADENAERMKQRLNKQIKTVFWMFAGSMLAYFIFRVLVVAVQSPWGLNEVFSALWNLEYWFKLLAFNDTGFISYAPHLWYVPAFLYAMVVIRVALKYVKLKRLYWLTLIILLWVPLTMWQANQGPDVPLAVVRNFWTHGIPCLLAGAWIKCNTQRILKWPRKLVIALPAALALLTVGEWLVYLQLGYGSLTVNTGATFFAASLMVLSIHFPSAGARTPFPRWGAKYSLMIYISHGVFSFLLYTAAVTWRFWDAIWFRLVAPVAVLLLSFGFAMLWEGAKDMRKGRKQAKAVV